MMYVQNPETIWNYLIREALSLETLFYILGAVVFFGCLVVVLEFLDSTTEGRK